MGDFQIAIRSYKRADLLADKTLAYLHDGCPQVDPADITVFVADDAQQAIYERAVGGGVGGFVQTGVGAREAFNGVLDHYPEGTHVMMLDDDLDGIIRRTGEQSSRPASLSAVAAEGFPVARQVGTPVWGIYQVANPYFMRDAVDVGLRRLDHQCMGFVIDRCIPRIELEEMHEQSHAIRCWETFGAIVRLAYFAPVTKAFGYEGGWQDHNRRHMRLRDRKTLLRRWPDLVTATTHNASGMPDARLAQKGPCVPLSERPSAG